MGFRQKYTYYERKNEALNILKKFPDRIPVICEKISGHNAPDINKHKYLVPLNLTIGQFIYVIRKRMILPKESALYLYINGTIPSSSQLLEYVYSYNKDTDLFLYISYSTENTFG